MTFIALQIVTNVYYHQAGLYEILGAAWIRPASVRSGNGSESLAVAVREPVPVPSGGPVPAGSGDGAPGGFSRGAPGGSGHGAPGGSGHGAR